MTDLAPVPDTLKVDDRDAVVVVRLNRPTKRNALNEATILGLERLFLNLPERVRAVVVSTTGEHFSAGLDLADLAERDAYEGMLHSRMWHRAFAAIEGGPVPVVSALRGAVIGGGLELAAATHVRVADSTAFYAMPEGTRGIYVGGGASVRVPRLIGLARAMDMMLTGRVYQADDGHAAGFTQYLVNDGEGETTAIELAEKMTTLAPATAYAIIQGLPRIASGNPDEGFLLESVLSAVVQSAPEAKARLAAFLEGRAAKVSRDG